MSLTLIAGLTIGLMALLVHVLALCVLESTEDKPTRIVMWPSLGAIVGIQLYLASHVPLATVMMHLQGAMPMFGCH